MNGLEDPFGLPKPQAWDSHEVVWAEGAWKLTEGLHHDERDRPQRGVQNQAEASCRASACGVTLADPEAEHKPTRRRLDGAGFTARP